MFRCGLTDSRVRVRGKGAECGTGDAGDNGVSDPVDLDGGPKTTERLTPQQQRFVQEYMTDLNATQAAIRAGYKAKNANVVGPWLVGKSRVRQAIEKLLAQRIARTEAAADRVLREATLFAFSDIGDYHIDDQGRLQVHPSAPPGARAAVRKFDRRKKTRTFGRGKNKVTATEEVVEIQMCDKMKALRLVSKHLGLITTRRQKQIRKLIAKLSPEAADELRRLLQQAVAQRLQSPTSGGVHSARPPLVQRERSGSTQGVPVLAAC